MISHKLLFVLGGVLIIVLAVRSASANLARIMRRPSIQVHGDAAFDAIPSQGTIEARVQKAVVSPQFPLMGRQLRRDEHLSNKDSWMSRQNSLSRQMKNEMLKRTRSASRQFGYVVRTRPLSPVLRMMTDKPVRKDYRNPSSMGQANGRNIWKYMYGRSLA